MTDFVYGNILTGEEHKTKKHILVLNAEPFYSEFLIQVLKSNSVKSPHPVIAFFAGDKILVISCLLYTSPSPRDLSTSRMPSSA